MANACCLHSIKEDGSRGEVAYNLSALFADAASAAGLRRIGIGRTQPISPVEGVPLQYSVLCSRMHAELSVDGYAVLLCDGGGMNGTYVNDKRLPAHTPTPLHNGDVISFGGGRTLQQMGSKPNPMQFIVSDPQALLTVDGQQAGAVEDVAVQSTEEASHSTSPLPAPTSAGQPHAATAAQTAAVAVATAGSAPSGHAIGQDEPSPSEPAVDSPGPHSSCAHSSRQGTPSQLEGQRRLPRSLQSSAEQRHERGQHTDPTAGETAQASEAAAAGQFPEMMALQQHIDAAMVSVQQHADAALQALDAAIASPTAAPSGRPQPLSGHLAPALQAAAEAGQCRAELDSGRRTQQLQQEQPQQPAQHQVEGTAGQQPDMQGRAAPQGLRARVQRLMSQQANRQVHAGSAPGQAQQTQTSSVNVSPPAAGRQMSSTPAAAVVVSSDDEAPSVGPPPVGPSPGQQLNSTGSSLRAPPHPSHTAAEARAAAAGGGRQLPHSLSQGAPPRRRLPQTVTHRRPVNAEVISLLDSDESDDELPQHLPAPRINHQAPHRRSAPAQAGNALGLASMPTAARLNRQQRQQHDEATSADPEILRPAQVARLAGQQDAASAAAVFAASQSASPAAAALAKLAAGSHACTSEPAAAAPAAAGDTTKALEDQFECTICRDWMVATHSMVPCGHMFCGACLGDWLPKKPTCPTCRITLEAPPVRSWAVDGLLDSLVAPTLPAADKSERARRQTDWERQATATTKRWKGLFDKPRHAAAEHGGGGGNPFVYMPGLHVDMGLELQQMLGDMEADMGMGMMRRHQNAQRQQRRRAAAPPPLPTPTLHGGGAAQHPQAARLRSGRRRAATPQPLQPPRPWPHQQEQPRLVPPPPQMAPPHGLGAYMPERQPPQQAPQRPQQQIHNAVVEYAGVRNPASRNRICSFCARRIDDGACLVRDTPGQNPGSNRGAHRGGFAYHLRCMPTNVWAQMAGLPAGFGVIAPDDQAYLQHCYATYAPRHGGP